MKLNHFYIFFIIAFTLLSCSDENIKKAFKEDAKGLGLKFSEKFHNFSFDKTRKCIYKSFEYIIKNPDTSINDLFLRNPGKMREILKKYLIDHDTITFRCKEAEKEVRWIPRNDSTNEIITYSKYLNIIDNFFCGFPYIEIYNYNYTEKLLLFMHFGDFMYSFSICVLEYNKEKKIPKNIIRLPDKKFVTSNGAYLGMRELELVRKYGFKKSNLTIYKNSLRRYGFRIDIGKSKNKFVFRHGTSYFAEYYVKEGKVVKIIFGFEYL